MSIELNHMIVGVRNRAESAEFLAHVLGLEVGTAWGPFTPVTTGSGVALDVVTLPPHVEVVTRPYGSGATS